MRGFSKAIIAGNLTRDPELRSTPNGAEVCSFTVAVNRSFRDSSGAQQDSVAFLDCAVWGKQAEIAKQYLRKGSSILLSGRLDQHSWEDKSTGQKRSRVEIVVDDFNFLDGLSQDGGAMGGGYGGGRGDYGGGGYGGGAGYGGGNVGVSMGMTGGGTVPSMVGETTEVIPEDVAEDEQIELEAIPF